MAIGPPMRGNWDVLGCWEASQNVSPARVGFHGRLKIDALDIKRGDKAIHLAPIWGYHGANDSSRTARGSEWAIAAATMSPSACYVRGRVRCEGCLAGIDPALFSRSDVACHCDGCWRVRVDPHLWCSQVEDLVIKSRIYEGLISVLSRRLLPLIPGGLSVGHRQVGSLPRRSWGKEGSSCGPAT